MQHRVCPKKCISQWSVLKFEIPFTAKQNIIKCIFERTVFYVISDEVESSLLWVSCNVEKSRTGWTDIFV